MKVAFVGPSIYPNASVRAVHGSAIVWRGPARQGDIVRAVRDGAVAIALIDGLYGTLAAVWHKEILFALSEGVRVIGGASLGALRAVECAPFGMEGFGVVFEDYASGRRVDDGDVALLHAPAELDFAPLTETLVDLDATLSSFVERDLLSDIAARRLTEAARTTFFWDRTTELICERAGFGSDEVDDFVALYEAERVFQKRADAMLVLDRLIASADVRKSRPTSWQPNATRSFRRLVSGGSTRRPLR